MRITSRTPPVRIAAADMVALASLPAEHAGLLLRWGMRRYSDGFGVAVEDARVESMMDPRAWSMFLHVARPFLDVAALDAGTIVVDAFARAADNLAKVSASKVRAPATRERAERAIGIAAMRAAGGARAGTAAPARSPTAAARTDIQVPTPVTPPTIDIAMPGPVAFMDASTPPPVADPDAWAPVANELAVRGATQAEIDGAMARWPTLYTVQDAVEALQSIANRRIAKPVRYLDTMLGNMTSSRRSAMPPATREATQGSLLPRPVRRQIRVGPRAGRTFEGWTAKGHPRGGEAVSDRRQIWRNETGGLSYNAPQPDEGRPVPTYEEDPGLYETD